MLVKPTGENQFDWWLGVDEPEPIAGQGGIDELSAAVRDSAIVMALPAEQVLLKSVPFSAGEKKLLRQTVPYTVEDDLAEDVDDLHFALAPPAQSEVDVAIVDRELVDRWLALFAERGLEVGRLLPEQLLLPWREGGWSLLVSEERWLLRCAKRQGFAIEADNAPLALSLLLTDSAELPGFVDLFCRGDDAEAVVTQLPEALQPLTTVQPQEHLRIDTHFDEAIDLRQGEFTRRIPWGRIWQQWRRPVLAGVAVLGLQFVYGALDYRQLAADKEAYREAIREQYRSVVPRGQIIDPVSQLRNKVSALGGSGGGSDLLPLLEKVGQAINSVEGTAPESINYSERQSEMRLTVNAPSFADVETLRSHIEDTGLIAELGGSSPSDDRVRAQIKIRRR